MRLKPGRWGWPLIAVLSMMGSTLASRAWTARSGPEAALRREVGAHLVSLLSKERAYYRNNFAYTTHLADLDPDLNPGLHQNGLLTGPWQFQIVATRLEREPLLLIEADNGDQQLCIDRHGRLYRSRPPRPLAIPPWAPSPEGGAYASAR